jgi:hypothetical protein
MSVFPPPHQSVKLVIVYFKQKLFCITDAWEIWGSEHKSEHSFVYFKVFVAIQKLFHGYQSFLKHADYVSCFPAYITRKTHFPSIEWFYSPNWASISTLHVSLMCLQCLLLAVLLSQCSSGFSTSSAYLFSRFPIGYFLSVCPFNYFIQNAGSFSLMCVYGQPPVIS